MFHPLEEFELSLRGEETCFYGVCGEFAHLFEGELETLLDENVLIEQIAAEHGRVVWVKS